MKKYIFCALMSMTFLMGCARIPKSIDVSYRRSIGDVCQQYNADCRWDGMLEMIVVEYRHLAIRGMVGHSYILVNGESRALSAPLAVHQGSVMVPVEFEDMLGGRALKEPIRKTMTDKVVFVIDAGHGGKDPGAVGFGGVQEKDITLDIAKRVKAGFEKSGVQVVMTRSTDSFVSLSDRTFLASHPQAGLFISIHANAHKNKNARGVEIYYPSILNQVDMQDNQRKSNLHKLSQEMNMQKNIPALKEIVGDMLHTSKVAYSSAFSHGLSQGFDSAEISAQTRGSKTARFYVLKNTLIPSVLVEVGFLTNPREARQLQQSQYRQKVADIIVKKILEVWYASGL